MHFIAKVMACAGALVTLAGCDPVTDRAYMNEGAGVDLYTSDRAQQAELLSQYLAFVCGPDNAICGNNWATVVYAGMNDIDQRCDGFLTWLDARRRDKEPILAQLAALTAATHSIMTVTGSSPKSLDILTAAFGLATASYTNWNSRLLISVNQSTVQQVVYKAQGDFRTQIKSYVIRDQPTAVYLLRNYLRLCMPITIEASINVHTLLVLNDAPDPRLSVVVSTMTPPTVLRDVNAPLTRFNPSSSAPGRIFDGPYEKRMPQKDMDRAMAILGCSGPDLGAKNSRARKALAKFLTDNGQPTSDKITDDVFITLRELKAGGKQGGCDA